MAAVAAAMVAMATAAMERVMVGVQGVVRAQTMVVEA
jgi:hypothetical protein